MKKIMNTTLVAVALTIAFVGNVDAKQLNRNATKANQDAAKELVVSKTKENVENTKDALLDTKNEEEAALQVYQAKELELVGRIAMQKYVIAAMPRVGYIWDTRTETEKDARKIADEQLKKLEDDMKDTKAEIAKITKSVGSEYARSTKLAIGALATAGVILVGYGADRYFETGYFPAAMEAGKAVGRKAMLKGKAGYEYGKSLAGRTYQYGKDTAASAYSKLPTVRGE